MSKRICKEDGCDKGWFCRGWCSMHYSRWQRHGDPSVAKAPTPPQRACEVEGCENPHRAKGWCQPHYMRWYREGDVRAAEPLPGLPSDDIHVRFWEKVNRGPAWRCWEWEGAQVPSGHGRFNWHGKSEAAYRVAHMWLIGDIPDGYEVDHLCHNPPCVNPWHLEAVTPEVNKARMLLPQKCSHGHEYTDDNTRIKSDGSRLCVTCARRRGRESYHRRKGSA